MDEIGFIQKRDSFGDGPEGRKKAFKRYLELAGVKIERQSTPPPATPPTESNIVPFEKPSAPASASTASTATIEDVWNTLHSRLILTGADRARLKEKRGFTDDTINELGFKSSVAGNVEILNSLRKDFPDHLLIDTGLFSKNRAGQLIPERQFMGWGITPEKDKDRKAIWGATQPILIPYLDANKRVLSMRPHKGGIAKRDKDDDEVCGGDVYCPFLLESRMDAFQDGSPLQNTAILTESEFKAAALWQAGFPAIGIPGTSFVRNPIFRARLVAVLEKFSIGTLIIVFDNEVKDNPDLPGYKPDPFERHWTVVWARYMAWDLMKRSPRPGSLTEVRIGQLPDEWRLDDNGKDTGKIDWDTALANFVRREGPIHGTARATREFEHVLLQASTPNEFLDLFPDTSQVIITTQLNHLWHVPLLKAGGDKQEKLARRLDKIGKTSTLEMQQWAQELSAALRSTVGTYYVLRAPPDKFRFTLQKKKQALNEAIAETQKQRGQRQVQNGLETADAKWERLQLERRLITEKLERGLPEAISNFVLKCEYCLHTADGKTERLVRIENTQGEKTSNLRLPAESQGRLAEFRVWCLQRTKGVAVWRGGEKDLQSLTEDMKHYSAWRNIYEIPHYGFDPNSKIWFAGDCAWAPDGNESKPNTLILPDANNIFWYGGTGYQVDTDPLALGEGFQQGPPLFMTRRSQGSETKAKELLQLLADGLFNTVGDYDGLLCLGLVLLYGASPEVYRDYGGHPGLWLYGKRGGGKTTVARWLMKLWGFKDLQGVRIDKGTTPVGMARNLNQYSLLPFWFDEFRRNIPDVDLKESVLRGAFDQSSTSKGRTDSATKTNIVRSMTMPIVSGESSSSDSATRSRYVHILIATSRRRKAGAENAELFRSLQAAAEHFHLIGKYILTNRSAYAKGVLEHLNVWVQNQTKIDDPRTRWIHGAGYAAFMALAEMLDIECDPKAFVAYLVKHASQAFEEVHDETMVNRFWTDVISGINRGAISKTFFFEKDLVLNSEGGHDPASMELGGAPRIPSVFIAAQEVFDEYSLDIRKRGDTAALSRNDIQREISKEHYWIPPVGANRIHRHQHNGKRYVCWAINLAEFPFGEQLTDALCLTAVST